MTLADDLKQTVYDGRAIAGTLGFRVHAVAIVVSYYAGQHTGESHIADEVTAITEANGQPPKVRQLKDDELALGTLPGGTLEIGPITPEFSGGGTADELLFGEGPKGSTKYVQITGPLNPTGARYRIVASTRDRALRRMLRVAPIAREPA